MSKQQFHNSVLTKTGRVFVTSLEKRLKEENLLEEVIQFHKSKNLVESYYWWYYELKDYPKRCIKCGNALKKFGGFNIGYLHETCSTRCNMLLEKTQEKIKNTNLSKYGATHQMRNEAVKQKLKSTVQTKYGADCVLQLSITKDGLRSKFGDVTNISQTNLWKEKTDRTFFEKFGGRGFSGSLSELSKNTLASRLSLTDHADFSFQQLAALAGSKRRLDGNATQNGFVINSFDAESRTITLTHSCGSTKQITLEEPSRWRCLACFPLKLSQFEVDVAKFLQEDCRAEIAVNDRKTIYPLELDILVPSKNFAIECNGDYWHSYDRPETTKEKNKHLLKLQAAEAAGIDLMQICEHEWREKSEIIKSIVRVRLGIAQKIFARKTEVRKITLSEAHRFCEDNHIQGKAPASLAIGAFYNDELVSVLTVGKNRFTGDGLELIRFANRKNTIIVGIFSRLLKLLSEFYPGAELESYLDRRLFSGASLFKNGWTLKRTSQPGYFWMVDGKRINRSKTQKHKLKQLLGERFDPALSEAQNMFNSGASRIWDCGMHVFSTKLFGSCINKKPFKIPGS